MPACRTRATSDASAEVQSAQVAPRLEEYDSGLGVTEPRYLLSFVSVLFLATGGFMLMPFSSALKCAKCVDRAVMSVAPEFAECMTQGGRLQRA